MYNGTITDALGGMVLWDVAYSAWLGDNRPIDEMVIKFVAEFKGFIVTLSK